MVESINYKVWFRNYHKNDHEYLRGYKIEQHALLFARGAAALAKATRSGKVYVEYPAGYFVEVN